MERMVEKQERRTCSFAAARMQRKHWNGINLELIIGENLALYIN